MTPEHTLWTSEDGRYEIAMHRSERLMVIDNELSYTDWPMLGAIGAIYDRPELWPRAVKDKVTAFLWQLRPEDNYPDLDGEVDYGCDCADCEVTNCHGECWQ